MTSLSLNISTGFHLAKLAAVALTIGAALAAHPAHAETRGSPATAPMQVRFSYDPTETPDQIYADLRQTARQACGLGTPNTARSHHARVICTEELLAKVVSQIGRKDVSELHHAQTAGGPSRRADTGEATACL